MALVFHDKVSSLDDGVELSVRVFHPDKPIQLPDGSVRYAVDGRIPALILVHPFGVMGGSGSLMWGLAQKLARQGYAVVSFDLRGASETWTKRSCLRTTFCQCRCRRVQWKLHIYAQ